MTRLDRTLKLNRHQAALRQIEAAIDAHDVGDFDIAITLSLAAEGMLPEIGRSLFSDMLMRLEATGARPLQGNWVSVLNDARDWLKHSGNKPVEIEIDEFDSEYAVARAISKLSIESDKVGAFKLRLLKPGSPASTG